MGKMEAKTRKAVLEELGAQVEQLEQAHRDREVEVLRLAVERDTALEEARRLREENLQLLELKGHVVDLVVAQGKLKLLLERELLQPQRPASAQLELVGSAR